MWLLTGLLFFVFIHECVPQGSEFRGRDGPPLRRRGGFREDPSGADVRVRSRGDRFGSRTRGRGGGAVFGECPAGRGIEGFSCYGRGSDVADCPPSSTCIRDRMSRRSQCCWDQASPVEAPCEDPRMTEDGRSFMQCVPGDTARERGGCPTCHRCQSLGRDMGMGLCCPQIQQRGCERSSPMRNAFEDARRRITGGGGLASTSVDTGSRFRDRGFSDRVTGDRMGSMPSPLGTDFGMTRTTGSGGGGDRVVCPNRLPPLGNCSAVILCSADQDCLEISGGIGGCCSRSPGVLPGTTGLTGMAGGSGRFMTGRTGRPGISGISERPTGMVSGTTRSSGVCPGGLPGISRCSPRFACGAGQTCEPVSRTEGLCCPMSGAQGMMGAPGSPGMMGAAGTPGMMGAPGSPGMMGAPGSPGMMGPMGSPGMMGGPRSPGMMGAPGSPGMMGAPGSPGMMSGPRSPGMMGTPGSPGMMGAPGSPGMMGAPGSPGMMGAPGSPGMMGSRGMMVAPGSPGMMGGPRSPGMMGTPGSPGMMGSRGMMGSPGMMGAPGSPAMMGAPGIPGMMGAPVSPGPMGSPAMMGAARSPGMMGSRGMMGASGSRSMTGSPDIEMRRFSPELLARRREMMRRTLARRRMLGVGSGARF